VPRRKTERRKMGLKGDSNTNVGSGGKTPSKALASRPGAGNSIRPRGARSGKSTRPKQSSGGMGATGGQWRFYAEDAPGLKVGPVSVLVMCLFFIAAVFLLHIWGKMTRG